MNPATGIASSINAVSAIRYRFRMELFELFFFVGHRGIWKWNVILGKQCDDSVAVWTSGDRPPAWFAVVFVGCFAG